ncbi:MAG TPA: M48 family metalloprotease [Balneolaceae bacterium]|nr:M48 family metalloprotease [Balneolaceae bacterium]
MRLRTILPTAFLLFFFTSSCVVQESPVTGTKRAYAYSWQQEVELGKDVDSEIVSQFGLYDDPEVSEYFSEISAVILENSHMRREDTPEKFRNTEFTFRVLDSPVVNAFALPGGFVYVTRGLMAHLNNEAQLAVVIGHEIGHVAARHASQRGLQQAIGQAVVVGGAIIGQEFLGVSGESILNLSGQAAQLIFLSYSRDHERESDRLGVEYAAMTGYDAAEGADFFTSLKRLSEKSGGGVPNLLSSHPDPGEREETIPEKAEEWRQKGYEQSILNKEEYMQLLDGMVFGENPRDGFERDGRFFHPNMEFQFPVPSGWNLINQPSQVVMVSPEEKGVSIFRIDGEAETARESVQNFLSNNEIETDSQRSTQSSGRYDAYEADFTVQQESQTLGVHLYAVEYQGTVYTFLSYSAESDFSEYLPIFKDTATNFDRLTDQSILNIDPVTIRVTRTSGEEVFSRLLPDDLPMDIDEEEVAILNQVNLGDVIPAGTLIKIPVQ